MKKLFLILIFTFSINSVFADSPLTSSVFYQAYLDMPIVQEAFKSKGKITNEMMEYIDNDANPLDIKLAIINAIGWDHNGLINSKIFFMYVMKNKKYKTDFSGDYMAFRWYATTDELICYAYMKAMDNYFDVVDAFDIASDALKKSPDSFAVNMIYNLIKCQGLTAFGEYCYASKMFLTLKDNPKLKMDMRKESLSYVFEYMTSIGENCKTNYFYK
jgi:hypothetical protein